MEISNWRLEVCIYILGPIGATCVDGVWSPEERPTCQPEQHPKLEYMYRGKRDVSIVDP